MSIHGDSGKGLGASHQTGLDGIGNLEMIHKLLQGKWNNYPNAFLQPYLEANR